FGPLAAAAVRRNAAAEGISEGTLYRAKKELGVVAAVADGVSRWSLPGWTEEDFLLKSPPAESKPGKAEAQSAEPAQPQPPTSRGGGGEAPPADPRIERQVLLQRLRRQLGMEDPEERACFPRENRQPFASGADGKPSAAPPTG